LHLIAAASCGEEVGRRRDQLRAGVAADPARPVCPLPERSELLNYFPARLQPEYRQVIQRLQGRSVLAYLHEALVAHRDDLPAPSLLANR
jgi:hypothetical protein